ncbi:hypothetical protein HED51_22960 [Ochrobactrum grignonense]|nr:hypothetical protein [Brucella grignonensis]
MIITNFEIRCCRHDQTKISGDALKDSGDQNGLEFLVYTLETDDGMTASMFAFAGRSARGSGELAAAGLRPLLVGREALDREALWHDFRKNDRFWNHLPIYSYGPADACLWLLGATAARQPLHKYIGSYRNEVPAYYSSMFFNSAEQYVAEALETKTQV